MQLLEVSGAVRHIYIYIYVIRQLKVKILNNTDYRLILDTPVEKRSRNSDFTPGICTPLS